MFLHREFTSNTDKILNMLAFEAIFEFGDNPKKLMKILNEHFRKLIKAETL